MPMHSSNCYVMLCKYKQHNQEELYLSLPIPRRLRRDLRCFRTASHNLEIEMGRHNISFEDRLCKLKCVEAQIYLQLKMNFM